MNNLYTTVDISGGLGSQLFQLAYAIYFLRLSKKQKIKRRLVFAKSSVSSYWDTIFKGLFRIIADDEYNNITFASYHSISAHKFIEPPSKAKEHIALKGKYETFKYIGDTLREKMINIVYSNEDIMYPAYYKYRDILNYFGDNTKDDDMVSLHIRRADYSSPSSSPSSSYNYNLPMSYYADALRIVNKKKVVIFSNDIEWCINNFRDCLSPLAALADYNIYYVSSKIFSEEELGSRAEIEFVLMSMFKNNIIANSYYSLWASFISYYKTKMVVAPKRWYSCDGCKEYDELYHKYITHII
jgi:hypothetical protein